MGPLLASKHVLMVNMPRISNVCYATQTVKLVKLQAQIVYRVGF